MTTKTTTAHTPKPWHVLAYGDDELHIVTVDEKTGMPNACLARVLRAQWNPADGSSPTMDANARLMAAAPTLLERLDVAEATILRLANTPARRASVQGTLDCIEKARALALPLR